MPIDQLIQALASDLKPARPRRAGPEFAMLGALASLELGLFIAAGQSRPDLTAAMSHPAFWWKLGSLGLLSLLSVAIAVASFDPVRSPRTGLRWLPVWIGACFFAGWVIDALRPGKPPLAERVQLGEGIGCVVTIVMLSLPPLMALGILMRRGASTDRTGTALAVGLAASAWGAFVFVFACPHDDPFWVGLWYSVACGIVALAARFILPPLTRW
jgi:hypothetical protein